MSAKDKQRTGKEFIENTHSLAVFDNDFDTTNPNLDPSGFFRDIVSTLWSARQATIIKPKANDYMIKDCWRNSVIEKLIHIC
jgi:hypothetical protein